MQNRMVRMWKTGNKKKFCVAAAVAVIAAAALFCSKPKTKDSEDAAVVRGGDTSSSAVESAGASDTVIENSDAPPYEEALKAAMKAIDKRLARKDFRSKKDFENALKVVRGARLEKRKAVFDSLKTVFFKGIDFEQDLSKRTMDELLYLRSSVYAAKGMYFKEENLNSHFLGHDSNIPWYRDYMCFLLEYEYENKGKVIAEEEKEIKLSDAEKRFIKRVDGRIAELRKDGMYVSKNGDTVGNIAHIVNMHKLNRDFDRTDKEKLARNNFVIQKTRYEQLFHIYEQNDYDRMPNFVTADLFLQSFHMYLSYILKIVEQEKFAPAMAVLCSELYEASMALAASKNAEIARIAEYNAAFYAIPYTLLTGEKLDAKVPKKYRDGYAAEVRLATEASADGVQSNFLTSLAPQGEPMLMNYSNFKPRGHYTRKPEMERYFRAMMWLQKAFACRDREAHLKQNIFTAILLNTTKTSYSRNGVLMDDYASVYEPTALLIGESNNLSVMDIALFLKKENIKEMSQALSDKSVEKVDGHLKSLAERVVIKPKALATCADKINFMPQRYLLDNEVLQELADIEKRPFPKGLDVFCALGSTAAGDVLDNFYKEGEKWGGYPDEMFRLQQKFKDFDGWNKSTYNKWLESLLTLQKRDKSYPAFMKTGAWDYKNLNTSLASWAELKHDFILYGERPEAIENGGCDDTYPLNLPDPDVEVGYVEPNVRFWNKLGELITMTGNVLAKHNMLDDELKGRTEKLAEEVKFLLGVSKKELAKTPLSPEEYKRIKKIGGEVEYFTLTVIDPERSFREGEWSLVQGADRSIAVAADVYTNPSGVLHAATGSANAIYVVVEINGFLYVTRGATFGYYEFVMPPGARLTDEEWQKMEADNSKRPAIPEWMQSVIINGGPAPKDDIHPINCFWRSDCDNDDADVY